jgi:SAM-dependent methyltransferase
METFEKKDINEYQKEKFENYENYLSGVYLKYYASVLEDSSRRKNLKILDLGGGSGHFALALADFFLRKGNEAEVCVLDITRYSTWNEFSDRVRFIEGSIFETEKYFQPGSFDLIFLNKVCHHLVQNTWRKTVRGISALLSRTGETLKKGGTLCISEVYYEGPLFLKEFSSVAIFALSSIKNPLVARILRLAGSKSSGVGVCFLSKKRWRSLLAGAGYEITSELDEPERGVKFLPLKFQNFYFISKRD